MKETPLHSRTFLDTSIYDATSVILQHISALMGFFKKDFTETVSSMYDWVRDSFTELVPTGFSSPNFDFFFKEIFKKVLEWEKMPNMS